MRTLNEIFCINRVLVGSSPFFCFLQDPVRYQDTEKVHHDLSWRPQSYEGDFLADNSSLVEYYWAPEPEKMIQIVRRKTAIKKQENTFKEQRHSLLQRLTID